MEDNHKLIIDKDEAPNIKRILEHALKWKSNQEIIEELENNNIMTPRLYLKEKHKIGIVLL